METDMKNTILSLFLLLAFTASSSFAQTNYYVDQQNGADVNSGTSPSAAFQSFAAATDAVAPGDTIFIIGEYTNPSYDPNYSYTNAHAPHLWHAENSIKINELHGTPSAYITIKAFDDRAILKGDGANILRIQNSSYLRIEDLEIQGEVENIPLATAHALQFVYIDADSVTDPLHPAPEDIRYRDQDCISNCTQDAVVEGEIYSSLADVNVSRPSYIDTRGMYSWGIIN